MSLKYYYKINYNSFDDLAKKLNEMIPNCQEVKIIQFGIEVDSTLNMQKPVLLVEFHFYTDAGKESFINKFINVKPVNHLKL